MRAEKRLEGKVEILDSLRAFAALSVCAYHFVCTTTGFVSNRYALAIFSFGKFGVQLFFVISGFVIPWAMWNAGYRVRNFFRFFVKRVTRLEPPYLFSLLLALAILLLRNYWLTPGTPLPVSSTQILLHIGYLIPFAPGYAWINQVYWTLAIEFQYYVLIGLLFPLFVHVNALVRIVVCSSFAAASFLTGANFLPYWLPYFLMGILIFQYKTGVSGRNEFSVLIVCVVFFLFFRDEAVSVCYALLPVLFLLYAENTRLPLLHRLGQLSYSIYLVHPLIGASLINVLSHHVTGIAMKSLVVFAGLVITLIAAYLMYRIVELPSKRLSSRLKYTPRS